MNGRRLRVALALFAAVVVLHTRDLSFEFLTYDDGDYVVHNPHVAEGLSGANLRWAWTAFHSANWHPLTWMSHQLDATLFGLAPAGHHASSVLLAALATALLFHFLAEATGRLGVSAFVAAAFGLHPLRVSSIAWVSERKDLLAAVFLFALLSAWLRFLRTGSRRAYLLALLCFALGLASKPSLIPVPLLLPLVSWWEHAEERGRRARPLGTHLAALAPFALLAAGSVLLTLRAQAAGGAVSTLAELPLAARLDQAMRSLVLYPWKTLVPTRLAFFHPHPALVDPHWSPFGGPFLLALVVVLGACVLAYRLRRRAPSLLFGLGAYVLLLGPALGLVQVGEQAWAERYATLSTPWLLAGVALALPAWRALPALAAILLALWSAAAFREAGNWHDSARLYRRALAVTDGNYVAEAALGAVLVNDGQPEAARLHFERAVALRGDYPEAQYGIGLVLQQTGYPSRAAEAYRRALVGQPSRPETWLNLGACLGSTGDLEGAVEAFARVIAYASPNDPVARTARANLEGLRAKLTEDAALPGAAPALGRLVARIDAALGSSSGR